MAKINLNEIFTKQTSKKSCQKSTKKKIIMNKKCEQYTRLYAGIIERITSLN